LADVIIDVGVACSEASDPSRVGVEPDDPVADFHRSHRQRKPDVSLSDHEYGQRRRQFALFSQLDCQSGATLRRPSRRIEQNMPVVLQKISTSPPSTTPFASAEVSVVS
jgi:hypothetical protein